MSTIERLLHAGARSRIKQQFVVVAKDEVDVVGVVETLRQHMAQTYTTTPVSKSSLTVKSDKKKNVPFVKEQVLNVLRENLPSGVEPSIMFDVQVSGTEIIVRAKRYNR